MQVLSAIAIANEKEGAFLDSGMEECLNIESQTNYKFHLQFRVENKSIFDVLKNKEMRRNILICCILLISNQIVYFGTAFAIDDIGVNMYINAFILGIAELLGLLCSGNFFY